MMAEPNTGTIVATTGAVTIILTQLGIDPLALAWGFAGGLVGQLGSENGSRWRVFSLIAAGALTAGALASIATFSLNQQFPSLPLVPLKVLVAFFIGVSWRHIVDGFRSAVPSLFAWLLQLLTRIRGTGKD